jgi:hypothetical protein
MEGGLHTKIITATTLWEKQRKGKEIFFWLSEVENSSINWKILQSCSQNGTGGNSVGSKLYKKWS